eukprot:GHVR01083221.1.p1 GENE.GHVR01083221.1~~GHVR01083221.1.p1  ORF type:complete len:142 (-),score=3.84 GHVR01083221.1:14-439(-)
MIIGHLKPGTPVYCEGLVGAPSGRMFKYYDKGFYCFNCMCIYQFGSLKKKRLPCVTKLLPEGQYLSSILDSNLLNKKFIAVDAPTESGKTTWLLSVISHLNSVLIIVPRKTLVDYYIGYRVGSFYTHIVQGRIILYTYSTG